MKKIVSHYAWNAFSSYLEIVLRLLGMIILARALLPDDFGIVAYIVSVFSIISSIASWGANIFVIQSRKCDDTLINTLFFGQLFLVIGLLVISLPLSLFLAPSFEGLVFVVLLIGLSRLLEQVTAPLLGLFMKQMKFKMLSMVKVVSELTAFVSTVLLLNMGHAFWALVIFTVVGTFIKLLAYLLLYVRKLRFELSRSVLRKAFHFGKFGFSTTILDKGFRQADDIFVNHVFGAFTLGLYSQAYRFSELFSNLTWGGIGSVTSSPFGNLQSKRKDLQKVFTIVASSLLHVMLLLYLPLFLVTEKIVLLLYGPNWTGMTPFIQLFVLFAFLTPLRRVFRSLMLHIGDAKSVAKSQFLEFMVFIVLLLSLPFIFGIVGVIVGVTIAMISGVWMLYKNVSLLFALSLRNIILLPLLCAIITVSIYMLTQSLIPYTSLLFDVIIRSGLVFVIYALLVIAFNHKDISILYNLVRSSD